jgi:hypothetical protein
MDTASFAVNCSSKLSAGKIFEAVLPSVDSDLIFGRVRPDVRVLRLSNKTTFTGAGLRIIRLMETYPDTFAAVVFFDLLILDRGQQLHLNSLAVTGENMVSRNVRESILYWFNHAIFLQVARYDIKSVYH